MIDLAPDDLRRYSLFAGLSDPVLEMVLPRLERRELQRGATVVHQGDHDGQVFFLLDGKVEIAVDGVALTVLGEGEQFGEMHLIDVQARSATVTAITPVTLLCLSNADLMAIRQIDQEAFILILMNCSRDVSRRLREMNRRYAAVMRAR